MKCWCKCTGRKPWAENVFTTGSNGFVTGRKQLRMSHVRVGPNTPAHCVICVHQFSAQRGVPVLYHPPYSPDLAPMDFFLFHHLKSIMKGARFAGVAAIQERVTAVLRSIPKEAFADSFQKLYERCQQCVVKDGDNFEGQ